MRNAVLALMLTATCATSVLAGPAGGDGCINRQTASLDGNFVYRQVCRWVTSDLIVQVRRRDGRTKEVTPGNSLAVIRNGPWRGFLLVQKHRRPIVNGLLDPTWVVRPDGKEMFYIPGSEKGDQTAVTRWLAKRGWRAS